MEYGLGGLLNNSKLIYSHNIPFLFEEPSSGVWLCHTFVVRSERASRVRVNGMVFISSDVVFPTA
jgi:hypothetical protein